MQTVVFISYDYYDFEKEAVIVISAQINNLYERLSEEDKNLVMDYLQSLISRNNSRKAQKIEKLFSEIDGILAEDKAWKTEEEMLQEMSEFRKPKK